MRSLLKFVIGALLVLAQASTAKEACKSSALYVQEVHTLPGAGYWMQSAGKCRVTYTTWGGYYSQMYNTCTNQKEDITDYIDAAPVPGGPGDDLYVHPVLGVSFFKMHGRGQSFYSDKDLNGDYESLGLLAGSTDSKRLVRIAMGSNFGAFRDYSVEKDGDDYKVEPVGDVKIPCHNLSNGSGGLTKETPILGRDGTLIAGRRYDSRKTEIYTLSKDGECKSIAKIHAETGKVNFSFDNKHVAYVIQDPVTNNGRLMEFDIKTGKSKTLSAPDEDVNYMTYKSDGTLMYSRRRQGSTLRHEENSELVVINSDSVPTPGTDKSKATEAVGMLWADACGKDLDSDSANAIGARLKPEFCQAVINNGDVRKLEAPYKHISPDELKAACAANSPAQPESGPAGTTK